MTIRFVRIGTGWGVAGTFTEMARAAQNGHPIEVRNRSGKVSRVVVEADSLVGGPGDRVCTALFRSADWSGRTPDPGRRTPRRRRRECPTGGNCSSFGDGRSCGAEDCDGW